MDDTRHHPRRRRCHSDRRLWYRTRADPLLGRFAPTLQATHLYCLFLHHRFRFDRIFGDSKFPVDEKELHSLCESSQAHAAEFSLARKISNPRPSNSSSINLSTTTAHLPTHTSAVTTALADEINHPVVANERTPLLDRKFGTKAPPPTGVKQISAMASTHRTRLILAISYASFSGIISGMCLIFAKSGVELLLLTLRGKNQFWRWEAWCLVLGLVAFALLQLWYLHKALILADPTIVCPCAHPFRFIIRHYWIDP
jgi:hypothetical protein